MLNLKQFSITLVLASALISNLSATTRSDVSVLEASESLQLAGQEIAQNYLIYHIYPKKTSLKESLKENLDTLSRSIKKISTNTNNNKTKGILSYFSTKKADIELALTQAPTLENAKNMVGVSELFSEGAKSISRHHLYLFSDEEKMIMLTKRISTHIGSAVKYYLGFTADPKDSSYNKKMKNLIATLQKEFKQLSEYGYTGKMVDISKNTYRKWKVLNKYLDAQKRIQAPMLIFFLANNIQKSLDTLSVYHSQNQ